MLTISVRDTVRGEYYRVRLTPGQAQRVDNGALISCGLTVGIDGMTRRRLDGWIRRGQATAVSHDEWNHSGCQSSCVRRGNAVCRW